MSDTTESWSIWDIDKQATEFAFTNTGDQRLVISEIKPSCGCTATQLDKKVYEPGEGAAIEVSFSPKGRGRQSKYIDVLSNGVQGAMRLTITADITPFVKVEPTSLVFRDRRRGEAHTMTFTVSSPDPAFTIESLSTAARAGGATRTSRAGEPE